LGHSVEIPHGLKTSQTFASFMQQSNGNSGNISAKKHVCNEQKSLNMSRNIRLKHFHISRGTNKIVLHIIKQIMQMVHHLCCCLYAGYSRTSQ